MYVDAYITIAPDATNPVGVPHTFTVTVKKNLGLGGGYVAAAGEHVNFTLTNGGNAAPSSTPQSSTCDNAGANTNASGQCTIVFNSQTPGTVTGHATVTLTIGGVTLTRDTDDTGQNSDDAVKTYITGAIKILKNSTKGGAVAQAGAVFSVTGDLLPAGFQVTDNGTNDGDPDVGEICVGGVTPGSNYTVNEVTPPTGYGDATPDQPGRRRRVRHLHYRDLRRREHGDVRQPAAVRHPGQLPRRRIHRDEHRVHHLRWELDARCQPGIRVAEVQDEDGHRLRRRERRSGQERDDHRVHLGGRPVAVDLSDRRSSTDVGDTGRGPGAIRGLFAI